MEQIFSDEESILPITPHPFIHLNLPVSGGHSATGQSLERNSRDSRVPSRRVADSKLTSFVPLTKRSPVVDSLVSKLNRAASSAGRRTIVERSWPLSSLTNHLGASGSRRSLARVRGSISTVEILSRSFCGSLKMKFLESIESNG